MSKLSFAVVVAGAIASAGFAGSATAQSDPALGALIGGGIGAAIGHAVNGRNGAWVGGAVGAVTGASIAVNRGGYVAAPAPVYYPPAPRYTVAAPYGPPPVVLTYVRPAPIYRMAPAVVYAPRPVVRARPYPVPVPVAYATPERHRGHGHDHWRHD